MKNEVNVELIVGHIPKPEDKSHKQMKERLEHTESDISNALDDNEMYCIPNKSYDTHLLMNQLHTMSNVLDSGSPSHSSSQSLPVSDINFDMYKDVSKLCDDLDMSVVVSKYGSHIEVCDDPQSPEYYNHVITNYSNGKYVSQVISHREADGSFYQDDVVITLNGDECKSTLSDIKEEMTIRLKNMYKQNIQQQSKDVGERVVENIVDVSKSDDKPFDMDIV